jgi:hypothetical protein
MCFDAKHLEELLGARETVQKKLAFMRKGFGIAQDARC